MSSPAERHAAARSRGAEERTQLARFRADYPFGLDPFQVDACRALEAGRGVLVAAPTGSGKTVVGEFAVHLALAAGQKCFYTTPPSLERAARAGSDAIGVALSGLEVGAPSGEPHAGLDPIMDLEYH